MKLIREGISGAGWSPPFVNDIDYLMLDKKLLQYLTILHPVIKEPFPNQIDKREQLEMTWFYLVGYDNQLLLRYRFNQDYFIEDSQIPPTDEQLIEVIKDSYKHLQGSFKDRLEEFIVFSPVKEIEDAVIRQSLEPLRELFPYP